MNKPESENKSRNKSGIVLILILCLSLFSFFSFVEDAHANPWQLYGYNNAENTSEFLVKPYLTTGLTEQVNSTWYQEGSGSMQYNRTAQIAEPYGYHVKFPAVEQLVEKHRNGGFEYGNLTEWSTAGDGYEYVTSAQKHSGTYSCAIEGNRAGNQWIQQDFAEPYPTKEEVIDWHFWVRSWAGGSTLAWIEILWNNGTDHWNVNSFGTGEDTLWHYVVIHNSSASMGVWASITAGSYIKSLKVESDPSTSAFYVDDFSLSVTAASAMYNSSDNFIFTHREKYFGFWLYLSLDISSSHKVNFIVGRREELRDVNGTYDYHGIQIYKGTGTSQIEYRITTSTAGSDSFTNIANHVWLYIELHSYEVNATSYTAEAHVNGTARTLLNSTGWALPEWHYFSAVFPYQTYIGSSSVNFDQLQVSDGWYFNPPDPGDLPSIDDLVLPDLEADEWVFTNWKYYIFNLSVTLPAWETAWSSVSLSFQDVANHNSTIVFDGSTETFSVYNESENENERYIRIQQRENPIIIESDNRTCYIDFEIWFTENLVDTYKEAIDVSVRGETPGWAVTKTFPDLFKIYNRGGFSLNYATSSSNAYRIAGGDVFEFYAQGSAAGSGIEWVYADLMYRNLQHIKELFQIQARVAYPGFTLLYGMDYYTKIDGWIHGWELQLDAINITVPRVSGSEAYWAWRAEWYFNSTLIKQDYFFTFPQGNPLNDGDYASSRIWLDFWFNLINGSSTWGGRVNSYYYPVKDNADAWLRVLSTNWGADDKRAKESVCFGTLKHNDGSTLQTQEIIFTRAWSRINVDNHLTLTQKITQFNADVQDLTLGRIPLIGIQTPSFDETKMPSLQTGGFLGALFSGFQWMGKWLAENIVWGGLNLWGNFVGFLDTIAAMFGAPNFFTNLFTRIGEGIDYMAQGFTYAFQIITQIFILIGSLLGTFVTVLADLVTSMINTITTFQDLMSGAIGGAGNLWNSLGISSWLMVALVFYPLYLIFLWEDEGMDAVLTQLGWIFGIASWLFSFFLQIIQFVIGMITSIIESIPIAE